MIILSDDLLLGKGKARACYFDPRDSTRCIKVDWPDRSFSQTKQEGKYYGWLAKNRPSFLYDCIPRFHGFVQTNRGPGGVFDLVRDNSTGKVSRTLHYYLHAGRVTNDPALWDDALQRLRNSILTNSLVIGDLNAVNICAKFDEKGSIHLVIVDGIGHRDAIPLCDYFPFLARRRSAHQISRFGITSSQALIDRFQKRKTRIDLETLPAVHTVRNRPSFSPPRVSVVITAYRHDAYITQALESVFSQTYHDYEVIVVNDGSPDNTEEVIQPYIDSGKIRYYRQLNQGVASARNLGWQKAQGQYIAFLDDDDIWPNDKLEWQVDCMDRSDAAIVAGQRKNFIQQPKNSGCASSQKTKKLRLIDFYRANPIGSPGQTLIRRSALEAVGGFDPEIWGVDDLDLWIRISKKSPLEMHQRLSLHYRVHPGNASRNRMNMLTNLHRVLIKNLDDCNMLTRFRLTLAGNRFIFRSGGKKLVQDAVHTWLNDRDTDSGRRLAVAINLLKWRLFLDPRLFVVFCWTIFKGILSDLNAKSAR